MSRYNLFFARDGEAYFDSSECKSKEAAESWAMATIALKLGLVFEEEVTLPEVWGETDGVMLMEVEAGCQNESIGRP